MIIISDKKYCCGCNACVQKCPQNCITMQADSEGFDYPIINLETCIDCGLCQKICPAINQYSSRKPIKIYAAKSKREEVRMKSSSGGIFTELAEQTIQDGGIVFGARFDSNWNVIHDYTDSIEGLAKFRGSKYVQSKIGNNYIYVEQFLKNNKKVLFSGTPCQIAGLRRFLNKEYKSLLLVDIVCYGVPSPLIWTDYINTLNKKNHLPITNILFRDKCTGWSNSSISITKSDSFVLNETLSKNMFITGFFSNLYLRPSCHKCSAKEGKSQSDITIADYWGINEVNASFNDNKGISLVMINTEKGVYIYQQTLTENIETTYHQALKNNWAIEQCPSKSELRSYFWDKYKFYGIKAINKTCNKLKPSFLSRILFKCKCILKTNLSEKHIILLKMIKTRKYYL